MLKSDFWSATGELFGSPEQLRHWLPGEWSLAAGWAPPVQAFLVSPQAEHLANFLQTRLRDGAVVFPPQPLRALALTPLAEVKVVILGQDPYHGPAQANGLAFSVPPGVRLPPSLRNVFKELTRDPLIQRPAPASGALECWSQQGVLLLNTCLTVEQGRPASHAGQGWEALTDRLIRHVSDGTVPVVFMLWGAHAQAKQTLIDSTRHQVLTANHPSPLSALRPPHPFIGCGHFSQANTWLARQGIRAIRW